MGRIDPEGTIAFLLPLLAGLAGATGLAWGGVKTAEKGAEIAAEPWATTPSRPNCPKRSRPWTRPPPTP